MNIFKYRNLNMNTREKETKEFSIQIAKMIVLRVHMNIGVTFGDPGQ